MSAKNTKNAPVSSLLNRPHLGGGDSTAVAPDPVIPTRIRTTLDNLIAYKDNPRQSKNPLFDEIKESIRNRGLDHAPNVTRCSPSDPYMIKDGGNTRLQAMRELYEETSDERFYKFDVMFYPWTSDLDVLIGHMIENEMRGNMLFIERAIAAIKIKSQLEETTEKPLSIRELAKQITAQGWSLDQAHLGQMLYAEATLFPVIPEAFWSGIGIDRVKKIRRVLEACRTYWDAVSVADDGNFDDVWKPVFGRLDGDGFDSEKAEYQLCGEIANRMDGPVLSVTAQVQAIESGVKGVTFERPSHRVITALVPPADKPRTTNTPSANNTAQPIVPTSDAQPDGSAPIKQALATNTVLNMPPQNVVGGHSDANSTVAGELGLRKYSLGEIPGGTPLLYKDYTVHDTKYLQARARDTAYAYAKRFGFESCIADMVGQEGKHIGFFVANTLLERMNHGLRIHWALLSTYALVRYDDSGSILLNTMAGALGGDIDMLETVQMLMAVTHARTILLGERSRGDYTFFNSVWEEITELEAIAAILTTRTHDESTLIDEMPDDSFIGVQRETGSQ